MRIILVLVFLISSIVSLTPSTQKIGCKVRAKKCPKDHRPVCAHKTCWICKHQATYNNACLACSDKKVDYYTPGPCR